MGGSYYATPLARKLGIKEGFRILLANPPAHYLELFTDLPVGLEFVERGEAQSIDLAHVFYTATKALESGVPPLIPMLRRNGCLWVSWPKGGSTIATDLRRDPIRESLIAMGLVDIKIASIDDDWSGLKFVIPVKDR